MRSKQVVIWNIRPLTTGERPRPPGSATSSRRHCLSYWRVKNPLRGLERVVDSGRILRVVVHAGELTRNELAYPLLVLWPAYGFWQVGRALKEGLVRRPRQMIAKNQSTYSEDAWEILRRRRNSRDGRSFGVYPLIAQLFRRAIFM